MPSLLTTLRQKTPQLTPTQFLAQHPGAWIQYYDDTPRKDPARALSAPAFNLAVARGKQLERCAICFSLQAFRDSRTKEGVVSFRNLGVDIDLIRASERRTLSLPEIDTRKEESLRRVLLPFPLKPHWLIETRHGFHVIFRLRPLQDAEGIQAAAAINRRLVSVLRGDENAALLTQVLRVPGTCQFKGPAPFLCRLLLDNAKTIEPYPLDVVRSTLDAWEVFHSTGKDAAPKRDNAAIASVPGAREWKAGLAGVPEGQRNATATAVVGGILGRLPEHLWETAGWGGLKEWNSRNTVPLPERELRSVLLSIARRESAKRHREGQVARGEGELPIRVLVEIRIERGSAGHAGNAESGTTVVVPTSSTPPLRHAEH